MALVMGCSWICEFTLMLWNLVEDDVLMVLIGRLIRVIEKAILGTWSKHVGLVLWAFVAC